jgi:hypothetical protein
MTTAMSSAHENCLEFVFSTLRPHEKITIGHVTFFGVNASKRILLLWQLLENWSEKLRNPGPPRQKRLPRFWRR